MYIGRFAPSPTGPLHFGSLVAAVASYCDARKNSGQWLVRMEDLDRPREVKGAADTILHQLEDFGFEWDGPVLHQSQRDTFYQQAFQAMQNKQLVYPCTCTRKEIADSSIAYGIEGAIYPQTCLQHPIKENAARAWRIKTPDQIIDFNDAIQGAVSQNLSRDIGDFILKRADGLFAYQLAVVVDDEAQGVTHVVRGADLLDSTPRQIYLQNMLGYSTPQYAHVPVASNDRGEKLSKQTLAKAVIAESASRMLFEALAFLGQEPDQRLKTAAVHEIWPLAISSWDLGKVPRQRAMAAQAG